MINFDASNMLFEISTKTSNPRRRIIINFTSAIMDFILSHFHNLTRQVTLVKMIKNDVYF